MSDDGMNTDVILILESFALGLDRHEAQHRCVECVNTEMGGATSVGFLSLYAGPDRALWADSIPRREMAMRPGALLQFDGGCTYDGYFCDFKRMASLG